MLADEKFFFCAETDRSVADNESLEIGGLSTILLFRYVCQV
jgi:hypothetical protein